MIRIHLTRQNSNHPDCRKRHPSRAICELAGRRYETAGPAPVYKLSTLLWLHGHGRAEFEVWDDLSPFGKPGGLAITGRVRNWARLVNGKPGFNRQARPEEEFTPEERAAIAQAAGTVTDLTERVSPGVAQAHTARSNPPDGPAPVPTGARWPLCGRCRRKGAGEHDGPVIAVGCRREDVAKAC